MRKSLYLFALLLLVTGCSKEDNDEQKKDEEPKTIQFTSTLEQSGTRSVSQTLQLTQLANGTVAGVFVTDEDRVILASDNNTRMIADGRGGFTYDSEIYWPDQGDANIYAYAPYQTSWTDRLDTDNTFSVAKDQTTDEAYLASDLVVGFPVNGNPLPQTEAAVALSFSHQLVKINIDLYNSTSNSMKGAAVRLTNVATSATVNLQKGAVSAQGTDVDTVQVAAYQTDAVNVSGSAIIAPQTIEAGTDVVDVVFADGTSLTAKIDADLHLLSGKTYNFTINIGIGGPQLTVSNSLANWDSNTTGITAYVEEPVNHIGDYLLKDGSIVEHDEVTDAIKGDIIAVIFSNKVSDLDAADGYEGYALGLKRHSGRSWYAGGSYGLAVSGLEEALSDLDGRTKAEAFHKTTIYKNITDSLAKAGVTKNIHISNFSDYSLQADESATNLSGWFCPTFGQLVQILNNLGGTKITASTITSKNDKGVVNFSNYSPFYKYDADESEDKVGNSTFINNINAYVTYAGQGNILAQGNISIATFTENKNRNSETYFELSINAGNSEPKSEAWEMTAAQGKWSTSSNAAVGGKSVLPVIAYKLK